MPKRRDKGDGSITKRKDGRFEARLIVGKDEFDKNIIKSFYGTTRQEALAKMKQSKLQVDTGNYIQPNKQTVKEWFNIWLNTYRKNQLRPSTYTTYSSRLEQHVYPLIGDIPIQNITPTTIQTLYTKKLECGRADGKPGGLSAQTIHHIHTLLYSAFDKALQIGLINKNPVNTTNPPKVNKSNRQALTRDEQQILENNIKNDRWGIACLVALYCGLRIGEIIALHWEDVHLEEGYMTITKAIYRTTVDNKSQVIIQPPKTTKGIRTVPIPSTLVEILKDFKIKESATDTDIVFKSRVGGYTESRNLARTFYDLTKKIGLEEKSFHLLRHTYASRLIEENVNLKIVQELVGHSSINITMDIYGHIGNDIKFEAAQKLNGIFKKSQAEE